MACNNCGRLTDKLIEADARIAALEAELAEAQATDRMRIESLNTTTKTLAAEIEKHGETLRLGVKWKQKYEAEREKVARLVEALEEMASHTGSTVDDVDELRGMARAAIDAAKGE